MTTATMAGVQAPAAFESREDPPRRKLTRMIRRRDDFHYGERGGGRGRGGEGRTGFERADLSR